MRENVISFLTLYQKKDDEVLPDRKIRQLHKGAESEIQKALKPFGYYEPVIASKLIKNNDSWLAEYTIKPGLPVTVKTVHITLAKEAPGVRIEDIRSAFPLKSGDIFYHPDYADGKKEILDRLYAQGFLDGELVKSRVEVTKKLKQADIILIISAGQQYYFGEVRYQQGLLDEEFLQKFINFRSGEPYSLGKLMKLQQNLYRTNYFSRVVVKGKVEDSDDYQIPVIIQLEDPDYFNKYSFGLGYATDDGIRATLGWDNRLFNKYGHTTSSKIITAQQEQSFSFVYGVPVGDPRFDKILYGSAYNNEEWEDTDTRLFTVGSSYEHSGNQFRYGGGVEIRDEKYQVGVTSGDSFLTVPSLNWAMYYGDDLLDTRNGFSLAVTMKGSVESFLAETTFLQTVVSGKLITTPLDGFRLIGRFSLGGTLVDSIDDLPPSLRFYAGGDQSVRGYGYKELGPTDDSGTVVGGKYLVFGSIEAEKTLYENWSGALFMDVGKGINELTEDLAEGVGAGIRYRLPFGQIRLDVASALSKDGNPLRIHLSVGGDL